MYTFRKHAREHGTRPYRQTLNTAVFTVRTRLCTRAVNTPVYRVHSRTRPCSGHGRTMYTACARPCTRTVKTAVYMAHGHVRAVYTAVFGSLTDHVHGPCMVEYSLYNPGHVPCTWAAPVHGRVCGRSRRVRPVYTTTQCIPGIAKVDSRNLLEGYYSNPIIRSLEIDLFTFSVAVTFWVTT